MEKLTGVERVSRQLKHQKVDRIAAYEGFWEFTLKNWIDQGKMTADKSAVEEFDLDIMEAWSFNTMIDPEFGRKTVEETEETLTYQDGNGAVLRTHKKHASTPEHLSWAINNREEWEEKAKPFLKATRNRINMGWYRDQKRKAAEQNRFFVWSGLNVFECMHCVCGHQTLLMEMALDPELTQDMANTFAQLTVDLMEILFAEEGTPDGIWFYEDMGFKGRPFMSPDMYREILQPAHKKTIDYAHSRKLPVIMHSCGFVEPLLPGMIEAGIDCLQAMEVKAGMDLLRIYKNYGEKIALMGGIDVRPIGLNDLEGIRRELESKIPFVMQNNGYILFSDHSIPESTEYETYKYFLDLGRKLGTYK